MIYKNSMKLLTSNFSFVWKQLAYTLVRLAIIIGLTTLVSKPILQILDAEGWVDNLTGLGETIYTNTFGFFVGLRQVIVQFFDIIVRNFSQIWYSICLFFLVVVVVNSYLKSIGKLALTSISRSTYTSLTDTSYCHSIIMDHKKMNRYAASRLLLDLPFAVLKIAFLGLYCVFMKNFILSIIGVTFLVIAYTLTYALQLTAYCGIGEQLIASGKSPLISAAKTYISPKEFSRVFSNAIIIVLTIIVTNVIIGIFTVGAGLFIVIPASMVLVVNFELVSYYTITKQRYYLSPQIIVDPSISADEPIKNN
jgi:hypothetical protein